MTELTPELQEKIRLLSEKYEASGQDMLSYLEGLIHSNYLTYWDYIHVDTLLTLQKPKTDFPDELIFIIYHQITELYFKLIHHELDQVLQHPTQAPAAQQNFLKRLSRINNYWRNLSDSYDVMTHGMDQQQFLQFRMSLLPASGFQTASFREIEFKSTSLYLLANAEFRAQNTPHSDLELLYENIYWKRGNIEVATGRKTLTLRMFEKQYDKHFLALAQKMATQNLRAYWQTMPAEIREHPDVIETLRAYDLNINVFWRLSHYRSAARYLQRDPEVIKATGGTNWQQYLPPRFQRITFFPEVWSTEQLEEWGKTWVLELFNERVEKKWSDQLKRTQG